MIGFLQIDHRCQRNDRDQNGDPRGVMIENVKLLLKIFCGNQLQKPASPEIRLIITQCQWNLFEDQKQPNSSKHSLDNSRRKIIGDTSQLQYTQRNLKKTGNHYGQ